MVIAVAALTVDVICVLKLDCELTHEVFVPAPPGSMVLFPTCWYGTPSRDR